MLSVYFDELCFLYNIIDIVVWLSMGVRVRNNSIPAQKISDVWIPAFLKRKKCYQAKILDKICQKKPNLIYDLNLKKTGNTFFSFVYIYKGREFKHLKFSVHVYYYFEPVISFFSRSSLGLESDLTKEFLSSWVPLWKLSKGGYSKKIGKMALTYRVLSSYKKRPNKEWLVDFEQIKEHRLVALKTAKARVPYFYLSEFLRLGTLFFFSLWNIILFMICMKKHQDMCKKGS